MTFLHPSAVCWQMNDKLPPLSPKMILLRVNTQSHCPQRKEFDTLGEV